MSLHINGTYGAQIVDERHTPVGLQHSPSNNPQWFPICVQAMKMNKHGALEWKIVGRFKELDAAMVSHSHLLKEMKQNESPF